MDEQRTVSRRHRYLKIASTFISQTVRRGILCSTRGQGDGRLGHPLSRDCPSPMLYWRRLAALKPPLRRALAGVGPPLCVVNLRWHPRLLAWCRGLPGWRPGTRSDAEVIALLPSACVQARPPSGT